MHLHVHIKGIGCGGSPCDVGYSRASRRPKIADGGDACRIPFMRPAVIHIRCYSKSVCRERCIAVLSIRNLQGICGNNVQIKGKNLAFS